MSKEALDKAAASVGLFDWDRAQILLGGGSYAENTALSALKELAKVLDEEAQLPERVQRLRDANGLDGLTCSYIEAELRSALKL